MVFSKFVEDERDTTQTLSWDNKTKERLYKTETCTRTWFKTASSSITFKSYSKYPVIYDDDSDDDFYNDDCDDCDSDSSFNETEEEEDEEYNADLMNTNVFAYT